MVRFLSKLILKYAKIFPSWERISEQKKDKILYRVVCGKEYFYPCFRAKMTKRILGDKEFAEYLDWYSSNIEYKDSSRLEIAEISIQVHENDEAVAYLKDGYGTLEIPIDELEQVVNLKDYPSESIDHDGKKLTMTWVPFGDTLEKGIVAKQSSAFIYNSKGQLLLVKNRDGNYSLPGGTVEDEEDVLSTCEREILEEASVTVRGLHRMGSINVTSEDGEDYLQVRYIGKLDEELPFDSDEFETIERVWVDLKDLNNYLPYSNGVIFSKTLSESLANLNKK